MRDRSQQMPGAVFVSCILGAAIIWAAVLRLNHFVPISDSIRTQSGKPSQNARSWPDLKIDINSANAAKMELLPGIGPRLAQRIIDYRRNNGSFRTLSDLQLVFGLGERSIERLKPYAVAEIGEEFGIAKHFPDKTIGGDYEKTIKDPTQD